MWRAAPTLVDSDDDTSCSTGTDRRWAAYGKTADVVDGILDGVELNDVEVLGGAGLVDDLDIVADPS